MRFGWERGSWSGSRQCPTAGQEDLQACPVCCMPWFVHVLLLHAVVHACKPCMLLCMHANMQTAHADMPPFLVHVQLRLGSTAILPPCICCCVMGRCCCLTPTASRWWTPPCCLSRQSGGSVAASFGLVRLREGPQAQ